MRTGISKDNLLARPHFIVATVENNVRGEKAIAVGSDSVGIPLMGLEPLASEPIAKKGFKETRDDKNSMQTLWANRDGQSQDRHLQRLQEITERI